MAEKKVIIRYEDISLSFGRKEILKNINLEVYEGETVAIIGPSGSGKSTLLRLTIGLLKPTQGKVWVQGRDVVKLSPQELNELRMQMGMVFQYSALFDSMDVAHNVAFSLMEHQKLSLEEAMILVKAKLEMVGLEGQERVMPSQLSGGMKKRVGLARAIVTDPPIVLYDEPTSGLDPVISRQIDDLIIKTQKNMGVSSLVVTHDMVGVMRIADRIAMLHEGEFAEISTREEFVKSSHPAVRQFLEYGLGR